MNNEKQETKEKITVLKEHNLKLQSDLKNVLQELTEEELNVQININQKCISDLNDKIIKINDPNILKIPEDKMKEALSAYELQKATYKKIKKRNTCS